MGEEMGLVTSTCTCVNFFQYFMETINFSGYFHYINCHGRHDMYSSLCREYAMSAAETKGRFTEAPSFSLTASRPATPFLERGAAFSYECDLRRKEGIFLYMATYLLVIERC